MPMKAQQRIKLSPAVLRLAGIKAASPDAKAFLESAVAGRALGMQDATTDRYGRIVAVVSVQGEPQSLEDGLLQAGMAFVYPATDDAHLDSWCESEHAARLAKRGFWRDHLDVAASDAENLYGQYGFIVGTVTKTERVKNKVYVTFGTDRGAGLTLMIAAHNLRAFKKQGLDALSWQGKTMRVRGWIKHDSTPAIILTDPHQVEVIKQPLISTHRSDKTACPVLSLPCDAPTSLCACR